MNTKIVIVSGGSRGLGLGLVEALLAQGHSVATFSRGPAPRIDELIAQGLPVIWRQADATDHNGIKKFVGEAHKHFGRIDALINNAAVLSEGVCGLVPFQQIEQSLQVNLIAPLILSHICAQHMLKNRSGVIINISSITALRGYKGMSVYSAAKGGLVSMTRSLAKELGPKGIRVNAVVPGYFASDMTSGVKDELTEKILRRTPLGRLGTIEDMVNMIRFLLSDDSSFMTGQLLVCDGGITC